MAPEPDPTIFSPQELAVINICKKLGPLPSRVGSEDIKNLASVFSEKAQEAVINSATVMGFLNRFMWVVALADAEVVIFRGRLSPLDAL